MEVPFLFGRRFAMSEYAALKLEATDSALWYRANSSGRPALLLERLVRVINDLEDKNDSLHRELVNRENGAE
jgi:hypothetical protein